MAVMKANFVKRGQGAAARAKATIRYIQHRRGKDGQTITRQLFGSDGPMDRADAYRMIDDAKQGSLFYRFVLSPDPRREDGKKDLDMRDLAEQAMRRLEERVGQPVLWVGALHADHAPHRHVHVVAIVSKRLHVSDLAALRERATEAVLEQRRMLDLSRGRARERPYPAIPTLRSTLLTSRFQSVATGRASSRTSFVPIRTCTCPRCGASSVHAARAPSSHPCSSCGTILHQGRALRLTEPSWGREAGWER